MATSDGAGDSPLSNNRAELFGLLSRATAIRIIECLRDCEEHSVSELSDSLNISAYEVEAYLVRLHGHGVLRVRQHGMRRSYRAEDERIFQLLELAAEVLAARRPPPWPGPAVP